MVRVSAQRQSGGSGSGAALNLFFAPILGVRSATVSVSATAALLPGVGVELKPNATQTAPLLPIALDVPTWTALMQGTGLDQYRYDAATGRVSSGPDGIKEVDLYPSGSSSMPPGNRGTVDLGNPNNSTADLKRQIIHGLNAEDLSWFGGQIRTDNGPLQINGDTGLSAGIKDALEQIIGQPRLIPLFSAVSGPGNNAMYTVPKFVSVRILSVQLTGKNKKVVVQPAPLVSPLIIRGGTSISPDSYFTTPKLIQ
jgi:hypothetical protein